MTTISLSEQETTYLTELLDSEMSGLRAEIVKTDSIDYKELLKSKKELLSGLQSKLSIAETATLQK